MNASCMNWKEERDCLLTHCDNCCLCQLWSNGSWDRDYAEIAITFRFSFLHKMNYIFGRGVEKKKRIFYRVFFSAGIAGKRKRSSCLNTLPKRFWRKKYLKFITLLCHHFNFIWFGLVIHQMNKIYFIKNHILKYTSSKTIAMLKYTSSKTIAMLKYTSSKSICSYLFK